MMRMNAFPLNGKVELATPYSQHVLDKTQINQSQMQNDTKKRKKIWSMQNALNHPSLSLNLFLI